MHNPHEEQFDDNGSLTASEPFDYAQVDNNLGLTDNEIQEIIALTPREIEAASKTVGRIMEWVWQTKPANRNGLEIRAAIACWIFVEWLRPTSLTQMAINISQDPNKAKAKQSLGRWVDDFKRRFPQIKTSNMKFDK